MIQADGSSIYIWQLAHGDPLSRADDAERPFRDAMLALSPIAGVPDITVPSAARSRRPSLTYCSRPSALVLADFEPH